MPPPLWATCSARSGCSIQEGAAKRPHSVMASHVEPVGLARLEEGTPLRGHSSEFKLVDAEVGISARILQLQLLGKRAPRCNSHGLAGLLLPPSSCNAMDTETSSCEGFATCIELHTKGLHRISHNAESIPVMHHSKVCLLKSLPGELVLSNPVASCFYRMQTRHIHLRRQEKLLADISR